MFDVKLEPHPRRRYCYSGRTLLLTDENGGFADDDLAGFYVEATRLVSKHEIRIGGEAPTIFIASSVTAHGFLGYAQASAPGLPKDALYLELRRVVGDGLRETLVVHDYAVRGDVELELTLRLDADFADLVSLKDGDEDAGFPVEKRWNADARELTFRCLEEKFDRAVAIRVESEDDVSWDGERLRFRVRLRAREKHEIELVYEPIFDGERRPTPRTDFTEPAARVQEIARDLREEAPTLRCANVDVQLAWETAVGDLASMAFGDEAGPASPMGGLPTYQQFFGRDTLFSGIQAAMALPRQLRDTLTIHARHQGKRIDDWRDEEPGRLVHQMRLGPKSLVGKDPFDAYFADYDAPIAFLLGLAADLAWNDDVEALRPLLPTARRCLDWLERYGDLDGDGLLEYPAGRSPKGLKNQGWKDSDDAIVDERGNVVEPPIALVELQGYWYAALRDVATVFLLAGDRAFALELLARARRLRRRIDEAFWMEDEGWYGLALDPNKRLLRSVASNGAHLLAAGVPRPSRARRMAARLVLPDLFSGWGVRTLSSNHPAFNPFSYHRGSVWPAEAGAIAAGLARYGLKDALHTLAAGLFAASALFVGHRLPEVMGGIGEDRLHPHPGIYRDANTPQAWSASVVVALVEALAGLRPASPLGLVVLTPALPEWLPELRLEGLRVGRNRFDLDLWRTKSGASKWRVRWREGRLGVVEQPAPADLRAYPLRRLRDLARSMPLAHRLGRRPSLAAPPHVESPSR